MEAVNSPLLPAPPPPPGGPTIRDPRKPWAVSPFSRLARAHAFGVAGDALFAIGLAGSVFFSLDFDSARWRVALYLVLTIVPFAVAAPFIGPALDRIRGGRRWIIVASMVLRALLCVLVVRYLDTVLFYPGAFGILVLGKVYTISKSAVVPGTVHNDTELVEANSKLTVLSALAVVVAAVPGGILLALGGSRWTVGLAAVAFAVAAAFAFKLPPTTVADEPPGEAEREELRSAGIFLAGTAMAVIRGVVGFLAFMLAFAFKDSGAPLWYLGVVAATAQVGFLVGAVVAPRLRRLLTEERILVGALVITAVAGTLTALVGGLLGAAVMSMVVGATGSSSKQAFDSIVQRDAPDANRGRSFARFETRFQMVWVSGALIPIVVSVPITLGFALVAVSATITLVWYLVGLRRIRQGRVPVRRQGWRRRPLYGPTRPGNTDGAPPAPPVTETARVEAQAPSGGTEDADPVATAGRGGTGVVSSDQAEVVDPTLIDIDRTIVGPRPAAVDGGGPRAHDPAEADPARRWMRPTPPSTPPAPTRPVPAGQGLLFGPDAWHEEAASESSPLADVDDDAGPPTAGC